MKKQGFLREYLEFSRKERLAILTLAVLIGIIFFLPDFMRGPTVKNRVAADSSWIAEFRELEKEERKETRFARHRREEPVSQFQYERRSSPGQKALFYFNPNTASEQEWRALGLREKTIETISRYRAKGGRFRKPEDLQRIYGLFPDEYERLAPFIRVEAEPATYPEDKNGFNSFPGKETTPALIEVNSADTGVLIALPGIGSKLAARMIAFRDKLGGFYSVNQVAETFGLPDSTFRKIKPRLRADPEGIRKINLNSVSVDELKTHPYIRFALAKAIIAYREEHGPFARAEDLKKILLITDDLYTKLAPYLLVN